MDFFRNFPFISIVFSLFSAVVCSLLPGKAARIWTVAAEAVLSLLSAGTLFYAVILGESVTYRMGHFGAPWGNEIRFGTLEALTALVFTLVLLLSVTGGTRYVTRDVPAKKINLYYLLINLLGAALLALVYTNDIFTGYVFLEILTLTSGGILMIREIGRTALAATRYMILNLLGSGLFLLGIILFYDVTGHLLMPDMHEALRELGRSGEYSLPLSVTTGLVCGGLAIKSGLFPFHTWMPDTYGFATPTSSAVLSGLVSKGYIFLLIKIMTRVIGLDNPILTVARNILFLFGLAGIVVGSVLAIRQNSAMRMISYSSAAQIGYIYMGIGLGGTAGFAAAIFHLLTHAVTKPLLFLSTASLMEVSGDSPVFHDLQGAAHRNRGAGLLFTVGAMSMIGIPILAGFTSKLLFSVAALDHLPIKTFSVLVILAVSTILNTLYFIRTVIRIYTSPEGKKEVRTPFLPQLPCILSGSMMAIMNVLLGLQSHPVLALIERGLALFS